MAISDFACPARSLARSLAGSVARSLPRSPLPRSLDRPLARLLEEKETGVDSWTAAGALMPLELYHAGEI